MNGETNKAEMIIKKSTELDIKLNAKNEYGLTPFHMACMHGFSKTVVMLFDQSNRNDINLNEKDIGELNY